MTELLLGIDIGTASSKAVLVTPDGEIMAHAMQEHTTTVPRPGWAEHDAERVWWADVLALCAELVPQAQGGIAALGVSGIGPCVVPCDAANKPLRPAILYGIDRRAEKETSELTELLGESEIRARGGSSLSSQALGPKLLWLKKNEPDVWRCTRRWYMASSYVVARLTGEWILDHHSASQCDPFYDLARCDWAEDWIELVLPDVCLPRLAWPGEVIGGVTDLGASATGIRKGTPVVAGTIDAWAEALSVDVRRPGDLMLMYGSTMFLVAVVQHPSRERSIWTTRGVDPGSLTLAAGLATSGSLVSWCRELLGGVEYDELLSEARSTPAGAAGLLVLPYFAGERTPILDPRARGAILGLTLQHTRGHLCRAIIEGIAYGVRHNLEAMDPLGIAHARAVGGGTRSRFWVQTVSDICGLAQSIPAETIGASYGDARLAAEGVGLVGSDTSWTRPCETLQPDLTTAELYDEFYDYYKQLYPATREIAHALAGIQERVPGAAHSAESPSIRSAT